MKMKFSYILFGLLILGGMSTSVYAHGKDGHPGPERGEMRGMQMMDGQGMSRMSMSNSLADQLDRMSCMLTGKMSMKPGMMKRMMKRVFFLDRIEELGLQKEQVERLKAIQSSCRRDNLRTATEVKIARFELADLLEDDWTLAAAEPLIRKIAKLEGDMKVRHLAAVKEGMGVLSAAQLDGLFSEDSPESLFD